MKSILIVTLLSLCFNAKSQTSKTGGDGGDGRPPNPDSVYYVELPVYGTVYTSEHIWHLHKKYESEYRKHKGRWEEFIKVYPNQYFSIDYALMMYWQGKYEAIVDIIYGIR